MRRRLTTARICGFASVVLALTVPLVFGILRADYDHIRQYISELGERDAPYAPIVNLAGFLPIGVLVLAFLASTKRFFPPSRSVTVGVWLFASVGLAYVVSAFFPCDPGCPASGAVSVRQLVHNFAVLEYVGAACGLAMLSRAFRQTGLWHPLALFSLICGGIAMAGFILMVLPEFDPWRGLAQRMAEIAIFGWIAAISIRLASLPVESTTY